MVRYTTAHRISQKGAQVKRQDIPQKTSRYRSYVVRCWQEHSVHAGREKKVWRFSLQDPRTDQRRGFATLEALLVSLQEDLADDEVD
jgi:hypothetical protein